MPLRRPPEFWRRDGWVASLLEPLARAYAAAAAARQARVQPYRAGIPVICVGNLTLGGAGKTPVVESLACMLRDAGHRPHILSRGHGGAAVGPLRVDATRHDAGEVGDEPLMLSRVAPVWVGRDRAASARAASAAGADCLVMDDGFQNPSLAKDFSLLVIDGDDGLGNGRVLPAGPLREPATAGLARADAVAIIGQDRTRLEPSLRPPVLHAVLQPVNGQAFHGRRVVAFAGIGRPEKFFASLAATGATVTAARPFPDHHRYRASELEALAMEAEAKSAALVTTEKDWARLSPGWRSRVETLAVTVAWSEERAVRHMLGVVLHDG